ncbi:MAG: hypothetical protein FWB85_11675 [Chitinispirillia bacterium]|nr:hypothetical protein [Chitinispirillia bacterium]MCL2242751.1 hypothetical protein [Chitinispirillia bacterium]
MQRLRVPRRRNASFKQALILLVLLVVIGILATGLYRSGFTSNLAGLINSDFESYRNLEQFDSAKTADVQREISGFWTYAEGETSSSPVAKREYMELIANGIFWQINDWYINTPSGGQRVVTQVMNGYVRPYSFSQDNSVYYCETRIIRQFFVADGDTCYGQSQVDEMWHIAKNENGTLTVNRRGYDKYEGDIKEFFPNGSLLDIIDKLTMNRCQSAASLPFMAKRTLSRTLVALPFFARAAMVDSIARAYYKPMVLDELARKYDPRAVPDVMDMRITLNAEGAVSDLKYRSGKIVTRPFDDQATMDIRGWLFPAVGDTNDEQGIELKIGMK